LLLLLLLLLLALLSLVRRRWCPTCKWRSGGGADGDGGRRADAGPNSSIQMGMVAL
jgi:hypothetical protein